MVAVGEGVGRLQFTINLMERTAQLIIVPVARVAFNIVPAFGSSERGSGGLVVPGSTSGMEAH